MAPDSWLSVHEREHRMGGRVYFACTGPVDWKPQDKPERMSFAMILMHVPHRFRKRRWRNSVSTAINSPQ